MRSMMNFRYFSPRCAPYGYCIFLGNSLDFCFVINHRELAMALRNSSAQYGSVAKFFHWLVFFFVLGLLIVGSLMGYLGDDSAIKGQVYNIHKLFGLTVLSLMVLRLGWTLMNPKPGLENVSAWERVAERWVHGSLYLFLLAMPVSGWVMSTAEGYNPHLFALSMPAPGIVKDEAVGDFFGGVHYYLAWTILIVLSIHLLAALKHHYIDKDNVLRRMMPEKKLTNLADNSS